LPLIIHLVDDNLLKSTERFIRDNNNVTSRRSYMTIKTMTMIGDATDFSTYKQPLTGVEHSRWDIGHRGIVSFGRVTPNSPGGPDGLVSGPIRTRSRFDDRKLLALI